MIMSPLSRNEFPSKFTNAQLLQSEETKSFVSVAFYEDITAIETNCTEQLIKTKQNIQHCLITSHVQNSHCTSTELQTSVIQS